LRRGTGTEAVEATFQIIKKTLENDDHVLISGFGKFCVKDKRKRGGRNPGTGQDLMLAERRVVTFTCSPVLKRKLNGGEGQFVESPAGPSSNVRNQSFHKSNPYPAGKYTAIF
jgi:integration host factor subunit alpha